MGSLYIGGYSVSKSKHIFADWAHKYHESGYSIIPVKGKSAFTSGWNLAGETKSSDSTIDLWCEQYPSHNIGLCLGKASGLVAFDYDYDGDGASSLEIILRKILPKSPCEKIGKKGFTLFSKYCGLSSMKFKIPGRDSAIFEFFSSSGQTVIPPSIHPETQKPYFWSEVSLLEVDKDDLQEITKDCLKKCIKACEDFFAFKEDIKSEKGRHSAIVDYGYAIVEDAENINDFCSSLYEYDQKNFGNNSYFNDPKERGRRCPQEYCNYIAESIIKTVKVKKESRGEKWIFGENVERKQEEKLGNYEQIGYYFRYTIEKKKGSPKIIDIPQYSLMANEVLKQRLFCFTDSGSYIWAKTNWEYLEELRLQNYIWNENIELINPIHIGNFVKAIKSANHVASLKFDSTEGLLNLNNGILRLKDRHVIPHSSDYFFKNTIPISYDQKAQCAEFLKWLSYILDDDVERIEAVQRMFGYVLIGGIPFLHLAFVLYGSGRNGKSTLLNILRALIGKDAYSVVSMGNLHKPFSAVHIDGKLANIVEETPTDEINSEIFKTCVGGGEIQVARKGKDEYNLKVTARFVFACNDMPVFKDRSEGLIDRLLLIPFNKYIPEGERDTELEGRLMTELPGILNWALEGADKILKEREIKAPKASVELKEAYREDSDALYSWFKNYVVVAQCQPEIFFCDIYLRYKDDCSSTGDYVLSEKRFMQRFKKLIRKSAKEKSIFFNENLQKDRTVAEKTVRNLRYYDILRLEERVYEKKNKDFSCVDWQSGR